MKEYGSFLGLDLNMGNEYYAGDNVKRLNTARCGIYYVLRLLGLKKIILPHFLCPSVRDFLLTKSVDISYTAIDAGLLPVLPVKVPSDTAVLVVNYFGLIPYEKIRLFTLKYRNVIVDHSQAFYKAPYENAYTVYSPRKFFGVPDGCYVIGALAGKERFEISQDYSADTSSFLLKRIERGCQASYSDRMANEARLDRSDLSNMSALTKALLRNIDYDAIKRKRIDNFNAACRFFTGLNRLDLRQFPLETDTVPMVYPIVIEHSAIQPFLLQNKVFVGRWWSHVTQSVPENSIEMTLSKYMLPLPIDQRMNSEDIERIYRLIAHRAGRGAFDNKLEK